MAGLSRRTMSSSTSRQCCLSTGAGATWAYVEGRRQPLVPSTRPLPYLSGGSRHFSGICRAALAPLARLCEQETDSRCGDLCCGGPTIDKPRELGNNVAHEGRRTQKALAAWLAGRLTRGDGRSDAQHLGRGVSRAHLLGFVRVALSCRDEPDGGAGSSRRLGGRRGCCLGSSRHGLARELVSPCPWPARRGHRRARDAARGSGTGSGGEAAYVASPPRPRVVQLDRARDVPGRVLGRAFDQPRHPDR